MGWKVECRVAQNCINGHNDRRHTARNLHEDLPQTTSNEEHPLWSDVVALPDRFDEKGQVQVKLVMGLMKIRHRRQLASLTEHTISRISNVSQWRITLMVGAESEDTHR